MNSKGEPIRNLLVVAAITATILGSGPALGSAEASHTRSSNDVCRVAQVWGFHFFGGGQVVFIIKDETKGRHGEWRVEPLPVPAAHWFAGSFYLRGMRLKAGSHFESVQVHLAGLHTAFFQFEECLLSDF